MRILFAPRNISGQAQEMAEAVRVYGHEAEVWSFGSPAFGFGADRVFDKDRLLTHPDYRWSMFDEAVRRFDVFHFIYGRSLLDPVDPVLPPLWDLPVLKFLGKRVLMHFRGSDVRLASLHQQREADSYFNNSPALVDEEAIRMRVSIARRHCDALLVSTPGLIDYVPDALLIGHTLDPKRWSRIRPAEPDVPVVVHIPTNPQIKGTPAIEAALKPLAQAGIIKYRRLENLSRAELREALGEADLVVDSLRIGDHGLISVEAMATGCIALAHIHARNRERNPGVPVVEVDAETLGSVVEELAKSPERRSELRKTGLDWVESRHSHRAVGLLLDALYRRPLADPVLHRPDWPVEAGPHRIIELERELERLTTQGHELFAGWAPPARESPSFLLDRLVARVRELERTVGELGGSIADPLGDRPVGRPSGRRSIRRLVRNKPTLHLWVRRLNKLIGRR
jgi:hypothetical protein